MIWGIFLWKKNSTVDEKDATYVEAKKFSPLMWILSVTATVISTLIVGYCLSLFDSNQPYLDAATNVIAIFAQIMMVKGYREQWPWWGVLDVICIVMWYRAGNWSMVAMYIAWTINCIYGWVNWSKLNKKQNKEITNA